MVDRNSELSDTEIEEIKMRCKRATLGPWISFVESRDKFSGSDFIRTASEDIYLTGATVADQDFIAHARQDIPRLIKELTRLKKLLGNRKPE
jgi:hypothetical protein